MMQALEHLTNATDIIELADQRAMAVDGPVGHVRDMMSDQEWRTMYQELERAKATLRLALDGTGV